MKWPTWSQALLAATIAALVALALRRSRPARLGDRFGQVAGPAALEFAFVASLYAIWRMAKNLPLTQADGAIERGSASLKGGAVKCRTTFPSPSPTHFSSPAP